MNSPRVISMRLMVGSANSVLEASSVCSQRSSIRAALTCSPVIVDFAMRDPQKWRSWY
jgi:hypothetical protein